MMFPIVTGIRFLNKKSAHLTSAPLAMPSGMSDMFAIECSAPKATKADTGKTFQQKLGRTKASNLSTYNRQELFDEI